MLTAIQLYFSRIPFAETVSTDVFITEKLDTALNILKNIIDTARMEREEMNNLVNVDDRKSVANSESSSASVIENPITDEHNSYQQFRDKEIKHEEKMAEHKVRNTKLITLRVVVAFLAIFATVFVFTQYRRQKDPDYKMNQIAATVQRYNTLHRFDDARLELNKVTDKKKYKKRINELEKLIDKAEEGYLNNNGIQAPVSSSYAKGKNYKNIVDKFKKQGFKNIKTEPIYEKNGLIAKKKIGDVVGITIDGIDSFKAKTLFLKTDTVRISYYAGET